MGSGACECLPVVDGWVSTGIYAANVQIHWMARLQVLDVSLHCTLDCFSAPSSTCAECVVLESVCLFTSEEVDVLPSQRPPGQLWRVSQQDSSGFRRYNQRKLKLGGHLVALAVTDQNQLMVGGNVPISRPLLVLPSRLCATCLRGLLAISESLVCARQHMMIDRHGGVLDEEVFHWVNRLTGLTGGTERSCWSDHPRPLRVDRFRVALRCQSVTH